MKKAGTSVTMEHVLLALGESKEERDQRIRALFNFFYVNNSGYLDYAKIEAGLSSLNIPSEYKYARDLLNVCDSNQDGVLIIKSFVAIWMIRSSSFTGFFKPSMLNTMVAFCLKSFIMRLSRQVCFVF